MDMKSRIASLTAEAIAGVWPDIEGLPDAEAIRPML